MNSRIMRIMSLILIFSLYTSLITGCTSRMNSGVSGHDDDKTGKIGGIFSKKDNGEENRDSKTREGIIQEQSFDIAGGDYDLRVDYYLSAVLPAVEGSDFNTFDVFKVYEDREEKVYSFDNLESLENGEAITGVRLMEGFGDLQGALVFTLEDLIMGLQSILVLGDVKGDYKELLYEGCYGEYLFKDIDSNGSTEILTSASNGGGYVSWWAGFYIAHTKSGGVYKTSYELTDAYYQTLEDECEKAFNKKKTADNLKAYLEALAFNGAIADVELLIQAYPDLISKLDASLTEDIPAETYSGYVTYQVTNYADYWDELFSGDPAYNSRKVQQQDSEKNDDPYIAFIRSLGDRESVVFDERQDIDLDGVEEVILATGSVGEITGIYCLRTEDGGIRQLGPDVQGGYGIYEVKLIQLENMPKTYIYCGLTNFANLYGFMLYEVSDGKLKETAYSASATGAGNDAIQDRDGDGQYDYLIQDRFSYDVLYLHTTNEFVWDGEAFVPSATHVEIPEYPMDVKDVVLQYLSLRVIDDGLCPDVTNRLKELCTLKDSAAPLDGMIWYNGVLYAYLGLDQTQMTSKVNGSQATVTITYKDDDGNSNSLTFSLTDKNDKWRIEKVS